MWILLYEFYIFLYKSFHMGVSPLNWCFLSLYLSLTSLSWPESFVLLEPETNCFLNFINFTAQKMKFSIKDIFIKCGQICRKLLIWSHLLNRSLMENFIFCSVFVRIPPISPLNPCISYYRKELLFLAHCSKNEVFH